jgi:hypothetical protein
LILIPRNYLCIWFLCGFINKKNMSSHERFSWLVGSATSFIPWKKKKLTFPFFKAYFIIVNSSCVKPYSISFFLPVQSAEMQAWMNDFNFWIIFLERLLTITLIFHFVFCVLRSDCNYPSVHLRSNVIVLFLTNFCVILKRGS